MCFFLAKLAAVGYGIKKLVITCVVEDDKVGTDDLEEAIVAFEDFVRFIRLFCHFFGNIVLIVVLDPSILVALVFATVAPTLLEQSERRPWKRC